MNIEKAIQMIRDSKKQGADLAVLPEMFNCPYENEKFIVSRGEKGELVEDRFSINNLILSLFFTFFNKNHLK